MSAMRVVLERVARGGAVPAPDPDPEMASCARFLGLGISTSAAGTAMNPEGVRGTGDAPPAARAAASCWSRRAFARRRFSSYFFCRGLLARHADPGPAELGLEKRMNAWDGTG